MNDLEKKIDPKHQALVDTVRKTIFPDSTDAELALFFHKCNVVGVNPLDQLIHPAKYKQSDGSFKVTFITSINLLRSKSDETETYDGMDEPEYEGETTYDYTDKQGVLTQYTAPDICRVKVYRKNIGRPFIGVARWKEYYPGDVKGFQYRVRPYHMIAKCAEALARRQAWPEKLNQLYTQEEMANVTEQIAGVSVSTKPKVNPDDVRPTGPAAQSSQDEPCQHAIVQDVKVKTGIGKNKDGKMFFVTLNGTDYSTFDLTLGASAIALKGKDAEYTIEIKGQYKNLMLIKPYIPPTKHAQEPQGASKTVQGTPSTPPAVEDAAAFATTLIMTGSDAGLDEAKIAGILLAEFNCTIDTVPAEQQAKVLERIKAA